MCKMPILKGIGLLILLGVAGAEDFSSELADSSHESDGFSHSVVNVVHKPQAYSYTAKSAPVAPSVHSFRSTPVHNAWNSHHQVQSPISHKTFIGRFSSFGDSHEVDDADNSRESILKVSHFGSHHNPASSAGSYHSSTGHVQYRQGATGFSQQHQHRPLTHQLHHSRNIILGGSNEAHDPDSSESLGTIHHFRSHHIPSNNAFQRSHFQQSGGVNINYRDSHEFADDDHDDDAKVHIFSQQRKIVNNVPAHFTPGSLPMVPKVAVYKTNQNLPLIHAFDSNEKYSAEDDYNSVQKVSYHMRNTQPLSNFKQSHISTHVVPDLDSAETHDDDSSEIHHVKIVHHKVEETQTQPTPVSPINYVPNIVRLNQPAPVQPIQTDYKLRKPAVSPFSYSVTYGGMHDDSVEVYKTPSFVPSHHAPVPKPGPHTYTKTEVSHQPQPQVDPQPITYSVQYGIKDDSVEVDDNSYVGFGLHNLGETSQLVPETPVAQPALYEAKDTQPASAPHVTMPLFNYTVRFGQKIDMSDESSVENALPDSPEVASHEVYDGHSDEIVKIETLHQPVDVTPLPTHPPNTHHAIETQTFSPHSTDAPTPQGGFSYSFRVGQHLVDSRESEENVYLVQNAPVVKTNQPEVPPTSNMYPNIGYTKTHHSVGSERKENPSHFSYSFNVGRDVDSAEDLVHVHNNFAANVETPAPSLNTSPLHNQGHIVRAHTYAGSNEHESDENIDPSILFRNQNAQNAQVSYAFSTQYGSSNERDIEDSSEFIDFSQVKPATYSIMHQRNEPIAQNHQYSLNLKTDSYEDHDNVDSIIRYNGVTPHLFGANVQSQHTSHAVQPVPQLSSIVHYTDDSTEDVDDIASVHVTSHVQPNAYSSQATHSSNFQNAPQPYIYQQIIETSNELDTDDDHDKIINYMSNYNSNSYTPSAKISTHQYRNNDDENGNGNIVRAFKSHSHQSPLTFKSSHHIVNLQDSNENDNDDIHMVLHQPMSPAVYRSAHNYAINTHDSHEADDDDNVHHVVSHISHNPTVYRSAQHHVVNVQDSTEVDNDDHSIHNVHWNSNVHANHHHMTAHTYGVNYDHDDDNDHDHDFDHDDK